MDDRDREWRKMLNDLRQDLSLMQALDPVYTFTPMEGKDPQSVPKIIRTWIAKEYIDGEFHSFCRNGKVYIVKIAEAETTT